MKLNVEKSQYVESTLSMSDKLEMHLNVLCQTLRPKCGLMYRFGGVFFITPNPLVPTSYTPQMHHLCDFFFFNIFNSTIALMWKIALHLNQYVVVHRVVLKRNDNQLNHLRF